MSNNSKLRDRAWPEITRSVWGVERMAVRDYMKTEWKKEKARKVEEIGTDVSLKKAAEQEAEDILEFWKHKYPDFPRPDTDSREFANWMLRKYHDMCEEREKVDPFDHIVPGPRVRY